MSQLTGGWQRAARDILSPGSPWTQLPADVLVLCCNPMGRNIFRLSHSPGNPSLGGTGKVSYPSAAMERAYAFPNERAGITQISSGTFCPCPLETRGPDL